MGDDKEKHLGALCSDNGSLEELETDLFPAGPEQQDFTDPCMAAMNPDISKDFRDRYPQDMKAWGQIREFSLDYLESIGLVEAEARAVYNKAKKKIGLPARVWGNCKKTVSQDKITDALREAYAEMTDEKK